MSTLNLDLLTGVEKRACDPRWEVRDSTVEFLGQLYCLPSRNSADSALLSERLTAPLLREALQDPESYVRASAVSALARGSAVPGGLRGTELSQEQVSEFDIFHEFESISLEIKACIGET